MRRVTLGRVLVIEGGGMKAAYANGVLTAFEQAGYRPWDAVYGTSAGGALACWYSAGQSEYAEETWKYARDRDILSFRRWVTRRGPLLDHDVLISRIYQREHPLDLDAVAASAHPVIVTATDIDSATVRYVDVRRQGVLDWIRATGRLPLTSNGPVTIDGRRYVDGGVLDPVPVGHPIAQGARHLTVILNKPRGHVETSPRWAVRLSERRYPRLGPAFALHESMKLDAIALVENPPEGVRIDIVRPKLDTGLSRLSRDLSTIKRGLRMGRSDGQAYLADLQSSTEELVPVSPTVG